MSWRKEWFQRDKRKTFEGGRNVQYIENGDGFTDVNMSELIKHVHFKYE